MTSRLGSVLFLVGMVACSNGTSDPATEGLTPTVLEETDGTLAGLRLEVPDGAYTGSEPLTMTTGTDIATEGLMDPSMTAQGVGEAVEFGPSGTQFAEPVTISLPFSRAAYNAVDLTEKKIGVLHQTADGSVAGFDVGPISKAGFDVGPISTEQIGFDVGPISITANEGNDTHDALLVFQTDHFSTFQVVVLGEPAGPGCTPSCAPGPLACGDDGCGGSCGNCEVDELCSDEGVCACVPECENKECGDDGCGGSCGLCAPGESCIDGWCIDDCAANCTNKNCGDDTCGGSCGTCSGQDECAPNGICTCMPKCSGKNCGPSGCAGIDCGPCGPGLMCIDFTCQQCFPACNNICGGVPDGCGGFCAMDCPPGKSCVANTCQDVCTPNCANKNCGADGCGGDCGICESGFSCGPNEQVCLPGTCVKAGIVFESQEVCYGNTLVECEKKGDDWDLTPIYCPAEGAVCAKTSFANPLHDICECNLEYCIDGNPCTHDFCTVTNECKTEDISGCGYAGNGGFYEIPSVGSPTINKAGDTQTIDPSMNFSTVTWEITTLVTTFTLHLLANWNETALIGPRHYSVLVRTLPSAGTSDEPWPYFGATHWVSWNREDPNKPDVWSCSLKTWKADVGWSGSPILDVAGLCSALLGTAEVKLILPTALFDPIASSFRVVVDYVDPNLGKVLQKTLTASGTDPNGSFIPFQ